MKHTKILAVIALFFIILAMAAIFSKDVPISKTLRKNVNATVQKA
jgi:hypothetical protein